MYLAARASYFIMRAFSRNHLLIFIFLVVILVAEAILSVSHVKGTWGSASPRKDGLRSSGNATLGFSKISFISLPDRFDHKDAMALQARLVGLTYEEESAVSYKDLDESLRGFPPSSKKQKTQVSEASCTRSHANVWRQMITENLETVLVLEGDATFDVDLRNQSIYLAEALRKLLRNEGRKVSTSSRDLWGSSEWDMIYFGACFEGWWFADHYVIYDDPSAPPTLYKWDGAGVDFETRPGERVIRHSGFPACTGAYAVSNRGARKLLLRTATDNSGPVDIMIGEEIVKQRIDAYTVWPPLIHQWEYVDGLGGGQEKNSDVRGNEVVDDYDAEVWRKVHDEVNIWQTRKFFQQWPFKNWALKEAGRRWMPPAKAEPPMKEGK